MIVVGNKRDYDKIFADSGADPQAMKAIETYVLSGGVIKLESVSPLKIVYPSKARLKQQLEETRGRRKKLEDEIKVLSKRKKDPLSKKAKAYSNPIYWKHLMKLVSDPEYKKAYETVDMPMEALCDSRHRKMVEMFVNNPEYRERLIEARTSVIGKSRGSIRETVEKSGKFREGVVSERLSKLMKECSTSQEKEKVYSKLLQFSSRMV